MGVVKLEVEGCGCSPGNFWGCCSFNWGMVAATASAIAHACLWSIIALKDLEDSEDLEDNDLKMAAVYGIIGFFLVLISIVCGWIGTFFKRFEFFVPAAIASWTFCCFDFCIFITGRFGEVPPQVLAASGVDAMLWTIAISSAAVTALL